MADFSDDEVIRGSEFRADPVLADVKFLRGGYDRLAQTSTQHSELLASMAKVLNDVQYSVSQLSKQFGKQPIRAESPRLTPPVQFSSDPYVRDDPNRLPLDNRKSLLRKIEMPKFDGSNAYDWLSKVERFFRVGRYSDWDKLDLVALSLEGDVLKWYNWEVGRREFQSWDDFRLRLFARFGAAPEESPGNRLFAIKQTGTISAYVTQFEELSAQVVGLSDAHLEQIFYNGLKTEMKEVLKLKDPIGLVNQKTAVLKMETSSFCNILSDKPANSWENQKSITPKPVTTYTHPRPLLLQNGEEQGAGQVAVLPAAKPPVVQPQQRHTADELDAMRSKGICFKCKGRYSREHKCPLKELQILTVVNGIELEVLDGEYSDSEDVTVDHNPTLCCLSLNSFLGRQSPKTIKLVGWIGDSSVLILIDSGASHNFITPSVLSKLNLKVSLDTNMEVLWGIGASVQSNGICRNVQFTLSDVQFQSDFISLELGGVDIVLGMQWLETLGTCVVDWKKQEWSFVYDGKPVKLVGDTSLHAPPLLLQPVEVSATSLCLSQEQKEVTAAVICQTHRSSTLSPAVVMDRFSKDAHFGRLKYMIHMGPSDGRHNHIMPQLQLIAFAVQNQYLPSSSRPVCTVGGQTNHVIFQAVIGEHQQAQCSDPPEMLAEDSWILAAILEMTFDELGRREFLIQWPDRDASENSWLYFKALIQLYLDFKLEDKLVFGEGSIDTTLQSYHRKNKKKMAVEVDVVAELWDLKEALG